MKPGRYKVRSLQDANESYDLDAETAAEAAFEALGMLGWAIVVEEI